SRRWYCPQDGRVGRRLFLIRDSYQSNHLMGVSFLCVSGRGLQIYFSEKGKLVGFICEWQEESFCLKWKPYFLL
ncbi:hypothetical protein, partial [uncultured Alloprevotella sp.]|uniref:hypothetical protein n=1 Tax=uncultured Alloprevotella sp. TaxID=1283315 RepID=UPI00325F9876